jgi:branched-chain amino acid transport system substrate-binding protein
MKSRLLGLLAVTALSVATGHAVQAQEILLGNLFAGAGPFATLARTNEIAAQMAVEEINAAGGVNGKKLKIISFDTAGKPEQAVVGVRKLAEDDKVMAIIGPFSSGECRVAFPAGERTGVVMMSMASSAPKLAEPFTYGLRNTSDEGYMFRHVMKTLQEKKYPAATGAVAYATDDVISKTMGENRNERCGHVSIPGLRPVRAGIAIEGDADGLDRRRRGTGIGDPPRARAAPAGP